MRIAFCTLGCKVNQYETQALERLFTQRGHALVPFEGEADVYVINSCTVTAVSDKKSRQTVRQARKRARSAVVALCGCYPQTHRSDIKDLPVDLVAGTGDRLGFVELVERAYKERQEKITALDDAMKRRAFEALPAGGLEGRTRAMLKVEDGCVNFCSYCIIPYARGPVRSLPLRDAATQAVKLAAEGYKELVLTGIEISSWGRDLRDGTSLIDLIEAVCSAAGCRVRAAGKPLPPLPSVHAERLRCHLAADEPEVRHRPFYGERGAFAKALPGPRHYHRHDCGLSRRD